MLRRPCQVRGRLGGGDDGSFGDGQDDRCERGIESQQQGEPVDHGRQVAAGQVVLRRVEMLSRPPGSASWSWPR